MPSESPNSTSLRTAGPWMASPNRMTSSGSAFSASRSDSTAASSSPSLGPHAEHGIANPRAPVRASRCRRGTDDAASWPGSGTRAAGAAAPGRSRPPEWPFAGRGPPSSPERPACPASAASRLTRSPVRWWSMLLGAEPLPRELLEVVVLFVGGSRRADDTELAAPLLNLLELRGHRRQRLATRRLPRTCRRSS